MFEDDARSAGAEIVPFRKVLGVTRPLIEWQLIRIARADQSREERPQDRSCAGTVSTYGFFAPSDRLSTHGVG
jgi:hypothetical protein